MHGRDPVELDCPYESVGPFAFGQFGLANVDSKPTTSEWKAAKIVCPKGTSKVCQKN